jgi:hypothetical protein
MNVRDSSRILGLYLLICSVYQVGIQYCSGFFPSPHTVFGYRYEHSSWFEFGTPRVVFFTNLDPPLSEVAYWGSAVWLVAIAIAMMAKPKRSLLRAYVVVELTLAILGLADIFVSMILRGILPGYAVRFDFELQTRAAVVFLFSVVPCAFALWMLRKTRVTKEL